MGMSEKIDAAIREYDITAIKRFGEQAKITGEVISRLSRALDELHTQVVALTKQMEELRASKATPVRGTTQK
jgi:hypothetical protein